MTTERTWKIRDQVGADKRGNVVWGPYREVTLDQYRRETAQAVERAKVIHRENIKAA
jgi:hypothetical protein